MLEGEKLWMLSRLGIEHLDVAVHAILPSHYCVDVFFNQVCNPWAKYLGHDSRSDVVRKCAFLYVNSDGWHDWVQGVFASVVLVLVLVLVLSLSLSSTCNLLNPP